MAYPFFRPATAAPRGIHALLTTHAPSSRRTLSSFLITPTELSNALAQNPPKISTNPRIIPLCASWFLPNDAQRRTGLADFRTAHIPSARFFDLDAVKDEASPYPHMLPSGEAFAAAMGKLGVRREDVLVVYDSAAMGLFSAPRVSWTLKVFGHARVHLLNNFKLWVEQGLPTERGDVAVEETQYPPATLDIARVAAFDKVKEVARDHGKEGAEGVQILDARPYGRWAGTEPEPRAGLPSGHIPGSISVPISDVLDPDTKTMLPKEKLQQVFLAKGIDPKKPIISSCGTGVTAAIIDAALDVAEFGKPQHRQLYDGSWTEWAQRTTVAEGLIKKAE
ncbi:MAG: hypothetical protein M1829_001246 [Trizodia sp. TS-e1964]|nr:MAG: hypothetical protein M1829_001246 [Trizodia sp. TS-e1964]